MLTIILAIIFIIRKPKYIPGNVIYGESYRNTQKLYNGYPTDRLTIRRESARPINLDTAVLSGGTSKLAAEQTEKLMGTEVLPGQGAEKLQEGPVPGGTAKLQQTEETAQPHTQCGTAVPSTETTKLSEKQTERLMDSETFPE